MFELSASGSLSTTTTVAAALLAVGITVSLLNKKRRTRVQKQDERVLIIGGSSGIGRAISHQYSQRGAKVCVVGRRQDALQEVQNECLALRSSMGQDAVLTIDADFADVADMIRVRDKLQSVWQGIDTVIVCAGVSALRPLLELAGVTSTGQPVTPEGVRRTVDVSNAALRGNYTGPLVSAVTFLPLLEATSASPAILLVSSLAALVPAPTRSLYASTKSASLVLYQALAIEHPRVQFAAVIPATVEGDFRASAVDKGPVRESEPNKHGLKREYVARRCIRAVDNGERAVFLPYWYSKFGHIMYWTLPGLVEYFAARKYNFSR